MRLAFFLNDYHSRFCFAFFTSLVPQFLLLSLALLHVQSCNPPPSSPPLNLPNFPQLSPLFTEGFVLLGVWENPTQDEVWFVGGNQDESVIAQYMQNSNRIRVRYRQEGGLLWWIWGNQERIWAGGDQGTLLSFDRQQDEWARERIDLEESALDKLIVWGVWGNENQQWAVGGSVRRGGPKGVLLKRQTQSTSTSDQPLWQRVQHPILPVEDPLDPLIGLNLYKIWGDQAGHLWVVGEGGFSFSFEESFDPLNPLLNSQETERTIPPTLLFTVHGQDQDHVWTVGGYQEGHLWQWNSSTHVWEAYPLPSIAPLNGVFASNQWLYLVGQQGFLGRIFREDPSLSPSPLPVSPSSFSEDRLQSQRILGTETMTFHAVSSIKNELWVVGGELDTLSQGVILTQIQPLPLLEIQ